MEDAVKRDKCLVLKEISKAPLSDADNRVFHALKNAGYAFDVPITPMVLSENFAYPCIRPVDMLRKTVDAGYIDKVFGVPDASRAETIFGKFWDKFKKTNPDHDLFDPTVDPLDYNHLIPYYLHGDGGRTYKKGSILVLSMFSALGMGTSKKPVTRPDQLINRKRKRHDDKWGTDAESLSMGVNLLGNSLANRFLFTGISVSHYKAMLSRLDTLLELWAKELRHLFEVGFEHGGHTWRVAILGITGDAPFLKEVGYHTRSFHNVRKSSNANTPLPGCCWLCLPGKTGGAPFEDTSIVSAQWLTTCGVDNDPPWTVPSPLLMHLAIDQRRPSEFFRPDIFHIYHAGVGKDFSASAIFLLFGQFSERGMLMILSL